MGRWILLGALGLLGAGVGLRLLEPDAANAGVAARLLPVRVAPVQLAGSYTRERAHAGRFRGRRQGPLGFERSGRLLRVLMDEGAVVEAGTLLAELDSESLRAQRRELVAARDREQAVLAEREAGPRAEQVAGARSHAKDLEIQRDLAAQQVQRLSRMVRDGIAPQEDLDRRTAECNSLAARLETAQHLLAELIEGTRPEQIDAQRSEVQLLEARVASLDLQLERSRLRAPYAGTIVARRAHEGAVLEAGAAVLEILEHQDPELHVGVPPEVADTLSVGDVHPVQVGRRRMEARIRGILPEVDPETRTQTVILVVVGGSPGGRAGEAGRLCLAETRTTEGFWLPQSALTRQERGLWSCLGVTTPEDGTPPRIVRHALEVLHVEADRVLVRGTLQEGDLVVMGGIERVVVGQPVEPLLEDGP